MGDRIGTSNCGLRVEPQAKSRRGDSVWGQWQSSSLQMRYQLCQAANGQDPSALEFERLELVIAHEPNPN